MSIPAGSRHPWRWRTLAGLLILASTLARLAFIHGQPFDLSPDEAHYWDWSRRLDWAYYSKGPLVAWLIRLSCDVLGDTPFAVRVPAVVCGALSLSALYVLTLQVYRRDSLALGVVAAALSLPAFHSIATLMTIDAPFSCLWAWSLVVGHQAAVRDRPWSWPVTGILVGLGVLAKYTMFLWPASLVLFLLADPARRRWLLGWRLLALICPILIACVPLLWWNWQQDWVTFRHVGGQAGVSGAGQSASGLPAFVGGQLLVLGVFWFLAWAFAVWGRRPGRALAQAGVGEAWLWWLSVPAFAVFAVFSFRVKVQLNWPLAAYLSGLVLAVAWVARQLADARPWYRRTTVVNLCVASIVTGCCVVLMHAPAMTRPVLVWLAGPVTAEEPAPLRRVDPTCRLRGWRELAGVVAEIREELRKKGCTPVTVGANWTLCGELAFYQADHPTIYSLGPGIGERRSQYECWHPNPIDDPTAFQGMTFLLVSVGPPPDVCEAFDVVERPVIVTPTVDGEPVNQFAVTVCRGYRSSVIGHRSSVIGRRF